MSLLHRAMPWLTLCLLVLLLSIDPANAQIVGGGAGGGGAGQAVLQWFISNIASVIIAGGVIIAGCMLIAGHHTFAGIGVMIVGALIISQWQTIAALFPV